MRGSNQVRGPKGRSSYILMLYMCCFNNTLGLLLSSGMRGNLDRPHHVGHQTDRTTRAKQRSCLHFPPQYKGKRKPDGSPLSTIPVQIRVVYRSPVRVDPPPSSEARHQDRDRGREHGCGDRSLTNTTGCPPGQKHTRCLSPPKRSQKCRNLFCNPGQKTNCLARNSMSRSHS